MSNERVYAAGLLNEALDPSRQPDAIRSFLYEEETLIHRIVGGSRGLLPSVVDLGCGTGRHLAGLAGKLRLGVGVDYEASYIAEARRRAARPSLRFIVGEATRVPLGPVFDHALCLTSSWGTMSDKEAVLREMRRLSPRDGSRLLTVYAPTSVPARKEWYGRLGHPVEEVTDDYILTRDGFRSEHFSPQRVRALIGPCTLHPIGEIAFLVQA